MDYFGTAHIFRAETGLSIIAAREEEVYFTWLQEGKPARSAKELFLLEWSEERNGTFALKVSLLNGLAEDSRQRQFERIVASIHQHLSHPPAPFRITPKDGFILVQQVHQRSDGKIGYGFYPYAEDEQGRWRDQLSVGLWMYHFGLFYEGIRRVYPLPLKGFEDFDPTGLNLIGQPEWNAILQHWTELADSNPSSAEMIQYVSQWTRSALSCVDTIAIQGNL
ncbi:hypothetical protein HQN87_12275 [Paenibacillus tritici]|uniref:Uncharacterized protein n=1 Tax=Paenibacillus tritici TaxID=1873425 RepID=A0ABX2DN95_9BACL|nr:hypothetical protein [Paenibacillus tritici]NQX46110.1 hypothetical protein [Paenibacillus tritici]